MLASVSGWHQASFMPPLNTSVTICVLHLDCAIDFHKILPGPMLLLLFQFHSAQEEHERQTVPTGEPKLTQAQVEVVTAHFPWANKPIVRSGRSKTQSQGWECLRRQSHIPCEVRNAQKSMKCKKRIGASWGYFIYESNLRYYNWAVQALQVFVNLVVGWMFTLVEKMKNSIGSKHALAEAQSRAEGQGFDIPWNGIIYSYFYYSYHYLPSFLWQLCQKQGQSGPESSYKAQSRLQKIILWSVGLVSVVPKTFSATTRCKRSWLLSPHPRFGSANNEADKQLRNLPEARCECNC